jgi:foldase protein PrsA
LGVYKRIRNIFGLGFIAIALACLAGCGGMPSDTVAQVGRYSISKATLDHWISVEAVTDYETNPRRPVPKGVVPDPPNYTACIARLEATTPTSTRGEAAAARTRLKSQCQHDYQAVRQHVLNVLITFDWLISESAKQGVTVTDKEVKQQYARFSHERFPKQGELERYLAFTGESLSDELLRMRIDLLSTKLVKKITATRGLTPRQQQQALVRFFQAFPKKWVAKTNCRTGYVVPNCKQYKGPLAPDDRI